MIAYRKWAAQAAMDFNNGEDFSDPALLGLETAAVAPYVSRVFADDAAAGLHYPGPLPFTPVAVAAQSATARQMSACAVDEGFAVLPATGKPPHALLVDPILVNVVLDGGTWKVNGTTSGTNFSCTNVSVAMPTWS